MMALELVDTHCHIQSIGAVSDDATIKKWHNGGVTDPDAIIAAAKEAGVTKLICVGTDLADSRRVLEFTKLRQNCWASIGIHPHDGAEFMHTTGAKDEFAHLIDENNGKIAAIGECGLDYYYENSPKNDQAEMLKFQLELAQKYNLPVIFHVREAFEDFWPIFDSFTGLTGVVHCFTGTPEEAEEALERGLYIALNGIMTFTSDEGQLLAAKSIPLGKLLLETDAPYLTPKPFRGKICKPEHVKQTAEFLANLRGETVEQMAKATTENAIRLFKLK
jgi:TatD DNase family protein